MSEDQSLSSLSYFERKEYEELKYNQSESVRRKREKAVFLGFFAISLIATLMISGAIDFQVPYFLRGY